MSNQEYYIKRFDSHNLVDVEQLHTAVYGKKPKDGFFQNKYNTAYTGVSYIGFVAYNQQNDVPIAYYGVIPCFIKQGEQVILTAQSADTMTHPQYRFKGLFVELSSLTFQLCRDNGIRLVFGFPNQNSVHGAIHKLGWQQTETLQCFVIPVRALPLEKLASKHAILKKLYGVYSRFVLNKHLLPQTGVPNSVFADGFGGVYRDAGYLQYKTYTNTSVIRLGKSAVWIKINNGLMVGDMLLNTPDFEDTMQQLKRIASKLGVSQIIIQTSPQSQLHGLLAKHYQSQPSFPVLFQDFDSGIPIDQIKFCFADIDVF